jgi:hypothetical protein
MRESQRQVMLTAKCVSRALGSVSAALE